MTPRATCIAVWTRSDGIVLPHPVLRLARRTGPGRPGEHLGRGPERLAAATSRSTRRATCWSVWSPHRRHEHPHPGRLQARRRQLRAPVTISDPGFDATKPQIDFDNSGKALAVWQRFDGTKLRVQATHPQRGRGRHVRERDDAVRGRRRTRSTRRPTRARTWTPTAWSSWTRSDGTNLRVQSSRRRDVVGYPRPKGATPMRVSLVPAYNQCTLVEPHPRAGAGLPVVQPAGAVFQRADRRHARRQRVRGELRCRR